MKKLPSKTTPCRRKVLGHLIMAPAYRALTAAEQVADEFFVPSPNPDATTESRLTHLWNARRNTTHGFNNNAEILAEHTGRLPATSFLCLWCTCSIS